MLGHRFSVCVVLIITGIVLSGCGSQEEPTADAQAPTTISIDGAAPTTTATPSSTPIALPSTTTTTGPQAMVPLVVGDTEKRAVELLESQEFAVSLIDLCDVTPCATEVSPGCSDFPGTDLVWRIMEQSIRTGSIVPVGQEIEIIRHWDCE